MNAGPPGLDETHDATRRSWVEGASGGESHQLNPLCGDEVTLRVVVSPAHTVEDLSWTGEGCSISQAATSVLHDLVVGRPLERTISR